MKFISADGKSFVDVSYDGDLLITEYLVNGRGGTIKCRGLVSNIVIGELRQLALRDMTRSMEGRNVVARSSD